MRPPLMKCTFQFIIPDALPDPTFLYIVYRKAMAVHVMGTPSRGVEKEMGGWDDEPHPTSIQKSEETQCHLEFPDDRNALVVPGTRQPQTRVCLLSSNVHIRQPLLPMSLTRCKPPYYHVLSGPRMSAVSYLSAVP